MDETPSLYSYRLRMGSHEQTGWLAVFLSTNTARPDQEHERRARQRRRSYAPHRGGAGATGVVFLTYRALEEVVRGRERATAGSALRFHG